MNRIIFIIDDSLNDVFGILLSLNAMLLSKLQGQTDQTHIVFLHIYWEKDDKKQSSDEERFQSEQQKVQKRISNVGLAQFCQAEYRQILLEKSVYNNGFATMVGRIIEEQKNFLPNEAVAASFPEKCGDDFSYAVLLDIVLKDSDCKAILNEEMVLSNHIYKEFPDERCIIYTAYDDDPSVVDNWVKNVGEVERPTPREFLTRARAIHVALQNQLYRALNIQ